MGEKGSKTTPDASLVCEESVRQLAPLGDISSKKMFGGYGIFESNVMFALVNSDGELHFKADDTNRDRYLEAGTDRHGRMPYYRVPEEIWSDSDALLEWAKISVNIAHAAKK